MLNGFLTEHDPLRDWTTADSAAGSHGQILYVKGAARSITLLALLLFFDIFGQSIRTFLPHLIKSLSCIDAVAPLASPFLESVALTNAQLGVRGAIRRPMDVFCGLPPSAR